MIGATLGHFRVLEKLGAGGMGEVYRARDEQLEREVTLTVLPAGSFSDAAARDAFLKNARAASNLNHPNICAIHEVGEVDPSTSSGQAVAFVATELVHGRPLATRLAEGPLRPDELLRYGLQLTAAVADAHEHGVVHGTLASAAIVLTPDGRVKVLGFGLAQTLSPQQLTEATTVAQAPMAPAVDVDTLAYLSPEQLRGQPADARSDVWALGVLLHEMATAQRPFPGQTAFEQTSAILSKAAAPLPADIPAELQAVIDRCLRKEPGQRYRRASDVHAALEAVQSGTATPRREATERRWTRRQWVAAAAAVVVVIAVAAGIIIGLLSGGLRTSSSAPTMHALAVLPLKNLSGDPDQQYFVDGLTDALINHLAELGGTLRVISRTSTEGYGRVPKPMPQIGRELGVEAIIEGSVAREGDLVRVTASLIETMTERRLWGHSYERNLTSILALQADIARAVAQSIKGALTPQDQQKLGRTREVNPQVYELYLRGMSLLQQSRPDAVNKGMALLHLAIEKDPTEPLAYAGLADGYITQAHGADPPEDALLRAKAAAQTAIELDPLLPQATFALGVIKGYDERDWAGAERELQRTIDLNPSFAMAHYHLAWFICLDPRRMPEAIQEQATARDLDPLNPLHTAWLSQLYSGDGQYDKALTEARKALELNPRFPIGYRVLGEFYARQGQWNQAIEAIQQAAEVDPAWRWLLGLYYVQAGRTADARLIMGELEKQPVAPWTALWRARLYAALGDTEAAFKWLSYEHPHIWVPWFLTKGTREPVYTALRDDPRFRVLQRKMNVLQWEE